MGSGRKFLACIVMLAACLGPTGCAVTRKSVSMDSGSKMPWLGMELAPQRRPPAPEVKRIRNDQSVPLEAVPAKLIKEDVPKEGGWWQKLTGTEKRAPIKLPRTDLDVSPPMTAKVAAPSVAESAEPLEF